MQSERTDQCRTNFMIFDYLKNSFARKKARRKFQTYEHEIKSHILEKEGMVEFANWLNPLVFHPVPNQESVNLFRKFITPGSLCIDIGAYIGDTAVPMSLAAGKDGLTLAFEPNPHTSKILDINVSLNRDKTNIKAFPYAITETDGEYYFNSSDASFANGGLSDYRESEHGKFKLEEKVVGKNLENFLKEKFAEWIDKLSLIKIDVEGHDKEILKSISALLEKYQPNIIAECNKRLTSEERVELFDSLAIHGYQLFYFYDFGLEEKEERLYKDSMDKRKHYDFYAVHESKLSAIQNGL